MTVLVAKSEVFSMQYVGAVVAVLSLEAAAGVIFFCQRSVSWKSMSSSIMFLTSLLGPLFEWIWLLHH
jgi:hypothetical protein